MKHAVIIAHPNPRSLAGAVGAAYAEAVAALGHSVVVRDLYRMGFDPCLKADEIPRPAGFQAAPDVVAERLQLADVGVFAFVYPFWFNAPPAILKGYIDRVFSMGFGYAPGMGGTEGLLDGKKLISFTSSGAPESWVRETGALQALMALFDLHLANMTGLRILDHVHVGGIVSDITPEAFEEVLAGVRGAVKAQFGEAAPGAAPGLRTGT